MVHADKNIKSKGRSSHSEGKERKTLFFQPKLNVGTPGDKYELEADKVAEAVVDGMAARNSFLNESTNDLFFSPVQNTNILNNNIQETGNLEEYNESTLTKQKENSEDVSTPEQETPNQFIQEKCSECAEEEKLQELQEEEEELPTVEQTGSADWVRMFPDSTVMEFAPLSVSGTVTVMDCSDGRNIHNNSDHDLDKLIHRPDDRSPDIWVYDNLLGESGAYSDFYIGFFTGTFGVDTSDDNRLFDNFTTGRGAQINFGTGSDMAREIGSTDAFTEFSDAFEESVRNYYDLHNTLHGFDCQAELIRTRPDYVGGTDSLFSWAVMGGYQRLEAHIDLSGGNLDITYRVFDHYGAGVSDAWSYLPGLSAMYYLQHYVTGSSNTYVPFIWSVSINHTTIL